MNQSIVRPALPSDAAEIWRLFLQGHIENGLFKLAPEKVQWFMNRCLNPEMIPPDDTGARGIIGVIGNPGYLHGLVFIIIGTYWYSNEKFLEECLLLVDPEYRRSGHAQALIQWMKDQVENTGLPLITGVISTHRTEAKCRLYRRMLPKIGEFYLVTPKGYSAPALASASS